MNVWILLALAGLVGASAFFSGMETALFSLQENQVRRFREKKLRIALALERLTADRRRLLSVILFSDVMVNVPLILLCLYLAESSANHLLPAWLLLLGLFGVVVIFCDLVPKLLALTHPLELAPLAVWYLDLAVPVLGKITGLLERATDQLAEWVTPKSMESKDTLSEGEFSTLIKLGAETGVIDNQERGIIAEIMKLADKTAKDCMTPRVDSFSMPDDLTNEEAITLLRTKRRRLVPIYGETPDDILGVLDVAVFLANPTQPYPEILVPPSFVAETMNALELLQSFLHRPQRIAIVVDEFGGTEGVVTFSDIVEEVISDAVPLGSDLYIEDAGPGKLIVSGHARLDDISERLHTTIEHEGLDTIGGYIFNKMGYVPRPGSVVEIPGYTLGIRRATKRRVQEVFIEKTESSSIEMEAA